MKGTNHRILFQNSEGNINMGVWFDDPNIDYYDISLFNFIAQLMENSLNLNEELISVDNELQTKSCYVELHRFRIYSFKMSLEFK